MYQMGQNPPGNTRRGLVALLNLHLAAAIDLRGQVKQAHWNMRGVRFIAIHELFDRIASTVADHADLLAKRIGDLGGVAEGTIQMATVASFLKPYALSAADGPSHVSAIVESLAAFRTSVHAAIDQADSLGDVATSDVFIELAHGVDHLLWLAEACQVAFRVYTR